MSLERVNKEEIPPKYRGFFKSTLDAFMATEWEGARVTGSGRKVSTLRVGFQHYIENANLPVEVRWDEKYVYLVRKEDHAESSGTDEQ